MRRVGCVGDLPFWVLCNLAHIEPLYSQRSILQTSASEVLVFVFFFFLNPVPLLVPAVSMLGLLGKS